MRKAYFYRAMVALCLMSFASEQMPAAQSKQTNSSWNGSITYAYTRTSHHAAPYSDFIYQKWNRNYEEHMQAKIANDTGTAQRNISVVDTSLSREQIGSRTVEQWEIETGKALGTTHTEVSINVDLQHKTYSIEVPMPGTKGNKTKTFFCKGCGQAPAEPVTTSLGEDETSIVVEDEKLSANPDVLSGEKTERKRIDNGEGEEITTTRWMFTRGKN